MEVENATALYEAWANACRTHVCEGFRTVPKELGSIFRIHPTVGENGELNLYCSGDHMRLPWKTVDPRVEIRIHTTTRRTTDYNWPWEVRGALDTETKLQKRRTEKGSGKKSEVVTVRLDPKLKYLAELCARKQRRTLSSFIEWAVERSLFDVMIEEDWQGRGLSVADAEKKYHLWDVDEPDRLVRLAIKYPDLLTIEEQITWKVILSREFFIGAMKACDDWKAFDDWMGRTELTKLLRDRWESIRAEAEGMKATLGRGKSRRPGNESSKEKAE